MSNVKLVTIVFLTVCFWSTCRPSNAYGVEYLTRKKIQITVGLIIFPPFIQQESADKCYGSAVDSLKDIFSDPKYTLVFHCASPARIYRDFNNGLIDITINVKNSMVFSENVMYSQNPYQTLEIFLYTRHDYKNKTVASINAYSYGGAKEILESQQYKFIELSNTEKAITVFLRGGTDSLLSYKQPFDHYLALNSDTNKYGNLNITFTQKALTTSSAYYVVNKKHNNAKILTRTIDEYYSKQANNN